MLGQRARIGYCSPPFVTETFPYEFYMMVPDGVTLMITTLEIRTRTKEEVTASHARSLVAAKYMADAGADVVVLGGNPINQTLGVENLSEVSDGLAKEIGTKVVTSTQAQMEALQTLDAQKVAQVYCYEDAENERHANSMRNMGCEPAGVLSCGSDFQNIGRVDGNLALDQIEQELDVSVMTSQQAIVWKALRTAGITEPIKGFGRLLREF
jgi:maleate cis-trans isomerase